jgi:hypothetical protein
MRHGRRPLDGAAILQMVARVEERLGIAPRARASTYRRVGSWLVEAGHLRRALVRGWRRPELTVLPYFAEASRRRGAARLVGDFHPRARWPARCAADVVSVRHNVRAFYLASAAPLTVKILLPGVRTPAEMRAEVAGRRRLPALGTVGVPSLLQADLEADPPYFTEEVVFGRRLRPAADAPLIATRLCPALWRAYEAQGFALRPISACVDATDAAALLGELAAAHAWPEGALSPAAFAAGALRALADDDDAPMLCAIGHGDLGLTNVLLAADGRLSILDWERTRELPVAVDLVRVLVAVPAARDVVRELVDRRAAAAPGATMASFDRQLLVAVLDALLRWSRDARARRRSQPSTAMRHYLVLASQLLSSGGAGAAGRHGERPFGG